MKIKLIITVAFLLIFLSIVSAVDFTPQGDINLRNVYNITGAPYVNATIYYGNGSQLTGVVTSTANYSTYSNLSYYWNSYNLASDLSYLILSYWSNITGRPTFLSNFTDDILWTSDFNSTGDGRWVNTDGDTMTGDLNIGNNDILNVNTINISNITYVHSFQSFDGNSILIQPTGDQDDFFTFKTPLDRPTIKREGGKFIYFESSNVNDVGVSFRKDDTYSGTLAYAKDDNIFKLLGKDSPIAIVPNSEYVNYLLFETFNHQPQISVFNGTILLINDSLEVTGIINASGKIYAEGNEVLTSYTETDPLWTANQSSYSTTTEANSLYAPTGYGDDWNETYADTLYLNSQLSMFFYNISDSFNSSYTIMNSTINPDEQVTIFTSLADGDNLIGKRINSGIQLSLLKSGAYNQHTTIDYITGTKDIQIKSTVHILYSNGTEVQIGSSPASSTLTPGINQQVIWSGIIDNDIIFEEGDYLTMYLYAVVSGGGVAPNINLVVGGTTSARLDIGISPSDISATETDPLAYNGTLAFLADILGWSYYNSTDFIISDYATDSKVDSLGNWSSSETEVLDHLSNISNPHSVNLSQLGDTEIISPAEDQILIYDLADNKWYNDGFEHFDDFNGFVFYYTKTSVDSLIASIGNFTAWDNFTGIPTATPSNGDITHLSTADQIYDWVIGLNYVANAITSLLQDTSPQLGGYLDTNGQNIGSTTDEIENIYVSTNTRIYMGDGQEGSIFFNGTNLIISG